MTGPNFAKLTLKELVEAFNKYTGKTLQVAVREQSGGREGGRGRVRRLVGGDEDHRQQQRAAQGLRGRNCHEGEEVSLSSRQCRP